MEAPMELTEEEVELRPLVTVVLATYNEEENVELCLVSILNQQTSSASTGKFDLEFLAVDGMSTDGTRAILERFASRDPRLRVINNPRRRTSSAYNLGLRLAHGEYVCMLGAHTVYRDNYIAVCLGELLAHHAAGCGGQVGTAAVNHTFGARLAALAMSHPLGSSSRSPHSRGEGPGDRVRYPVLRRQAALAAGGYDEDLLCSEANDLNQRLRAAGHVLWCTGKTHCLYFSKASVAGLFRHAYGNGFWNVLSLAKNPAAVGMRHFVPFLFVISLVITAFIAITVGLAPVPDSWMAVLPFAGLVGLHLALGLVAAVQVAIRERSPVALCLPPVFLAFHAAYGFGTLHAFLSQPWAAWLSKQRPRRGSEAGD